MLPRLLVERPLGRERSAAALHRRLLPWYRRHRRDLPWRATRDPYRIWISEVMLQQTQVTAATPFYQTFVGRFPDVASLAAAREADVLAAWAGLGYYRRARSLHAAARTVVREHAGRIPRDPEGFGSLPGVGRYTVGAVLSIAFDLPLPVLDGNVARVLARLEALPISVRDPRGAKTLWDTATRWVPMREAGDWNQALMELGATVCTPKSPRCTACPLKTQCRAHALGRVADFPAVAPRRARTTLERAVAVIERGGRVLMARRSGALLDGLWEPPGVDVSAGANGGAALRAELRRLGVEARLARTTTTVRHSITHRDIEVRVWRGTLAAPLARRAGLRWVDAAKPAVAVTALGKRLGRADAR